MRHTFVDMFVTHSHLIFQVYTEPGVVKEANGNPAVLDSAINQTTVCDNRHLKPHTMAGIPNMGLVFCWHFPSSLGGLWWSDSQNLELLFIYTIYLKYL